MVAKIETLSVILQIPTMSLLLVFDSANICSYRVRHKADVTFPVIIDV